MRASLRPLLKPLWYTFFRYHPHHYLGAVFWAVLGRQARSEFQRLVLKPAPFMRRFRFRCVYRYLMDDYYERYLDAVGIPPPNREQIWGARPGTEWHLEMLRYYSKRRDEFDQEHAPIFRRVKELLAVEEYDRVIELGCGNGLLIETMAAQAVDTRAHFVGLDLNAEIIALNRKRYPRSRVEYRQCDTLQDYLAEVRPACVLVMVNGAFEYFTEKELSKCLRGLAQSVPRGALVVYATTWLELQREQHSRPASALMFSHNYSFLLARAGLENVCCQVESVPGSSTKLVLASATWGSKGSAGQERAEVLASRAPGAKEG